MRAVRLRGRERAVGIAAGFVADVVFGDPRRGHPVALFGRGAGQLEQALYRASRGRGVAYAALAVAGPVGLGIIGERWAARRPVLATVVTAVATWTALGGASLAREGLLMAAALEGGDLPAARDRLTHLCARDPSGLTAPELARATVESLAENSSDAVIAPLFWAAVAGAPGVLGYRAVNTLDAMVGYRSPRYEQFGWASARFDDLVNLVPARITGLLTVAGAPPAGGSARAAWRVWRRDHGRHPSPNAGHCEASAAGALGLRLGGVNVYGGEVEGRPEMGEGRPPEVADVRRAVRLERSVALAGAALAVTGALALGRQREHFRSRTARSREERVCAGR